MKFSAAQAAKQVGKSTATITRAIEKGRISAEKDDTGAWAIDAAELFRVFAPAKPENPSMQRDANPHETVEINGLSRLVETLQEQLEQMRVERAEDRADHAEALADVRKDRDHWREEAQALRRLLPAPATQDTPAAGQGTPARGFWARLWGKDAANG